MHYYKDSSETERAALWCRMKDWRKELVTAITEGVPGAQYNGDHKVTRGKESVSLTVDRWGHGLTMVATVNYGQYFRETKAGLPTRAVVEAVRNELEVAAQRHEIQAVNAAAREKAYAALAAVGIRADEDNRRARVVHPEDGASPRVEVTSNGSVNIDITTDAQRAVALLQLLRKEGLIK